MNIVDATKEEARALRLIEDWQQEMVGLPETLYFEVLEHKIAEALAETQSLFRNKPVGTTYVLLEDGLREVTAEIEAERNRADQMYDLISDLEGWFSLVQEDLEEHLPFDFIRFQHRIWAALGRIQICFHCDEPLGPERVRVDGKSFCEQGCADEWEEESAL